MSDGYHDPKGIVHRDRIVQTADNIERLDEAIDKLSIEIEVMQEKIKNCHERAAELLRISAQEGGDGV